MRSSLSVDVVFKVRSFRHDPDAFTQGLLWSNGSLFESTGLYGRSSLREVQLKSNGHFVANKVFVYYTAFYCILRSS